MLKSLDIARFKSLRDQSLSFGRVNLFIGGNGAGKSNILEAIGLASACLDRGLGDSDIGRKGLRITPPELMKSSFKNETLPKTLELTAKFSGAIEYKVSLQSSEKDPLLRFFSESCVVGSTKMFGRSYRGARATGVSHSERLDPSRGIWDQIRATYPIPEAVNDELALFSKYVIYSPQTDFLRGRQVGRVDVPPIGLHGEGLPEAVDSFLTTWRVQRNKNLKAKDTSPEWKILESSTELAWLPGWAFQFGVHRASSGLISRDLADRSGQTVYFVDRFMHESRNRLSVYDSSEGTLFLLFAAIILGHPEAPKIFALDNVDNSLNPRLTRKLVEQIINVTKLSSGLKSSIGAKQVFLTSHNPTALDAFDIFDEDVRVFVVRRNEKGHTVADRLRPADGLTREGWEVAKGGKNLSQLWLEGAIPGALGGKL